MARISTQMTGALLVFLAALCWVIAFVEWVLKGHASLVAVATALMFTAMVVLLPFLQKQGEGTGLSKACRQCGALPMAFARFCIRCGAYPKPVARPRTPSRVPA